MKTKILLTSLFLSLIFTSCINEDKLPAEENDEELITYVKLIFTNIADVNDKVEVTAIDPDGTGALGLSVGGPINLGKSKIYTLTYEIKNNLTTPGENILEEIKEEAKDHQLFYSFTNNLFINPTGDGNIDNASDPVNYKDLDGNSLPIGLETEWTTGSATVSGKFKVMLQHQPDIKSSTSTATSGDTDFELEFDININ